MDDRIGGGAATWQAWLMFGEPSSAGRAVSGPVGRDGLLSLIADCGAAPLRSGEALIIGVVG